MYVQSTEDMVHAHFVGGGDGDGNQFFPTSETCDNEEAIPTYSDQYDASNSNEYNALFLGTREQLQTWKDSYLYWQSKMDVLFHNYHELNPELPHLLMYYDDMRLLTAGYFENSLLFNDIQGKYYTSDPNITYLPTSEETGNDGLSINNYYYDFQYCNGFNTSQSNDASYKSEYIPTFAYAEDNHKHLESQYLSPTNVIDALQNYGYEYFPFTSAEEVHEDSEDYESFNSSVFNPIIVVPNNYLSSESEYSEFLRAFPDGDEICDHYDDQESISTTTTTDVSIPIMKITKKRGFKLINYPTTELAYLNRGSSRDLELVCKDGGVLFVNRTFFKSCTKRFEISENTSIMYVNVPFKELSEIMWFITSGELRVPVRRLPAILDAADDMELESFTQLIRDIINNGQSCGLYNLSKRSDGSDRKNRLSI